MSYLIPDADSLIDVVKSFTGSSNTQEIKECIFLAEMMLRNIELPILRSDPYAAAYIATADADGRIGIPADMNRPILFFKQGGEEASSTGPWIVYDRVGDRDIIEQGLLNNLFITNPTAPQVMRGKFSEVANKYQFVPELGEGDQVNLYYYRAWPFLFSDDGEGGEVQNNGVLQSFPEGYIYGTLHNYYLKRKMAEDSNFWRAKFDDAMTTINNQNNKGKWSGGNGQLSSAFQPRRAGRVTLVR
jgi:hypothetical protein